VLHTGDLHLGLRSRVTDPETGLDTGLLSTGRCWRQACMMAAERDADVVIVAGDGFNGRDPDRHAYNQFRGGLDVLREAAIPAVLIAGNHDGDGVARPEATAIEAFRGMDNVYVSTLPEVLRLPNGLSVATLPWVSREWLMARYEDLTRAEASQAVIDSLCRIVEDLAAAGADVLTGHWSVEGCTLSSEIDISVTGEAAIPADALGGPWSYVAMSHIHRHQELKTPVLGLYAGSLDRITFAEEHEDKGVVEVDLDSGAWRFHPVDARRYLTLDLQASEWDPDQVQGAIVRIVGPRTGEDDAADLLRFAREHGAVDVKDRRATERPAVERRSEISEALTVPQLLDAYLPASGVSEELWTQVRDRSLEYAREVGA
jgi:DNA repair exonuclease SbcCD nuclease subunit